MKNHLQSNFPHKRRLSWLSLVTTAMLLVPLPTIAQETSGTEVGDEANVLLEVDGVLDLQDAQLEDGRHYDAHPLMVDGGQILKISVESGEFDTYLRFVNPAGEIVTENDDSDATNSLIVLQVPQAGTYEIWVHGFDGQQLGNYQLTAQLGTELDLRKAEADRLNQEGMQFYHQAEYLQAMAKFEQSLAIREAIGDRQGVGESLNNIGGIYDRQGEYGQALEYFQQSLAIREAIGDREGEGITLANIGHVLNEQEKPELAIVLLKKSVNVREFIRQNISASAQASQQSYVNTVADDYRFLADLLLGQGRILEAQQVLELLKVEELQEFTRGEVLDITTREIKLSEAETTIWEKYDGLIDLGKRLEEQGCNAEGFDTNQCTPLFQQRTALTAEFNDSVDSFMAEFRTRLPEDPSALNPDNFIGEADDILQTPGTALIYPVVLNDKLWVLWATSGGVVNSVSVPVTQQQLGEAVLCFRQLLDNPLAASCDTRGTTDIQTVAQDLYHYLIPPQLEQEFAQQAEAGTPVNNLVFSLDRVTRYIPMAALHDGNNYLIEDFTISTILSAGLTRTDNPLPSTIDDTSVLALGLSEAVPENPSRGTPGFNALHHVPAEIEAIATAYPGQPWMNDEWNDTTFYDLPNHQILHMATHGKFVPAAHDLSYFILGNKEPFPIRDIENIQQSFADLSLVVLSACETALGEPDQDGIEINGIAHSFIKAGANNVLASLWQVSDGSTSYLMQQFYDNLAQSTPEAPVTISSALRQAQLTLLNGGEDSGQDVSDNEGDRGAVSIRINPDRLPDNSTTVTADLSHPYYWAPFILIGNGL